MIAARKVSSGWGLMEALLESVEEWRSVLITFGGQCVMMDGI